MLTLAYEAVAFACASFCLRNIVIFLFTVSIPYLTATALYAVLPLVVSSRFFVKSSIKNKVQMADVLGQTARKICFVLKSKIPMCRKLKKRTKVWPKKSVNLNLVLINHPSKPGKLLMDNQKLKLVLNWFLSP